MPLTTDVRRLDALPKLAWIVRRRGNRVDAAVGAGVTVSDTGFFEGGFALTDDPREVRPEALHFGSGVAWRDDELAVITPSHPLEAAFVVAADSDVWVSNSLPLVVSASGITGFDIWRARRALRSIHQGLTKAHRDIQSTPNGRLLRFANAIVRIGDDLEPRETQQRQTLQFDSFETYAAHIRSVLSEALASSGADDFGVFLSRGYDSPACAALARSVAPTHAICVESITGDADDDGAIVADILGLPVHSLKRHIRDGPAKQVDDGWIMRAQVITPEDYEDVYEFFSGFSIGDEIMRDSAEAIADKAVVTGWAGDVMWTLNGTPWRDFARNDRGSVGANGLGEFRLRTGFTHVPVSAIGFNHADVVRRIGTSKALAPWRLDTDYDRPVPRRIIEESGVPRGQFAIRKAGASPTRALNLYEVAATLFEMQKARYAPALRTWPPD